MLTLHKIRIGRFLTSLPVAILFGLSLLPVLVSCTTTKIQPRYEFVPIESSRHDDILAPGDVIQIDFFYWPEIGSNGQKTETIRPDGKISLPFKQEIRAEGLTVQQLTDQLNRIYSDLLKAPSITVTLQSKVNQEIYVGGEVSAPGKYDLKGGSMTALQAIMTAGGFKNMSAKPENVIVIRHYNNKRYIASLDMTAALDGADKEPFYLAAQDIIFVPRTQIDKINQWVTQHLTNIITISGFSFGYHPSSDWNFFIGQ